MTDKAGDTPLHCVVRAWEPHKKEQASAAATALLAVGANPLAANKKKVGGWVGGWAGGRAKWQEGPLSVFLSHPLEECPRHKDFANHSCPACMQ